MPSLVVLTVVKQDCGYLRASELRAKIEWRVARASIPIPEEQMASSKISYNFFRNVLSRLVC